MPAYKTIVLELLRDRPTLHEQLRASRTMLESLNNLAMALRTCHHAWMNQLAETKPGRASESGGETGPSTRKDPLRERRFSCPAG